MYNGCKADRNRRKDQKYSCREFKNPAEELDYEIELFGDGIGLDSIDSLEIIAGIDQEFGVQMTGVAKENFYNIEALSKYVMEHMED